jgi:hypothetical protein
MTKGYIRFANHFGPSGRQPSRRGRVSEAPCRSTTTPMIATATAVSTVASGSHKAAIAWSPSTRTLGPNADIKETAQRGGQVEAVWGRAERGRDGTIQ